VNPHSNSNGHPCAIGHFVQRQRTPLIKTFGVTVLQGCLCGCSGCVATTATTYNIATARLSVSLISSLPLPAKPHCRGHCQRFHIIGRLDCTHPPTVKVLMSQMLAHVLVSLACPAQPASLVEGQLSSPVSLHQGQ
jgi:hypothetical protein